MVAILLVLYCCCGERACLSFLVVCVCVCVCGGGGVGGERDRVVSPWSSVVHQMANLIHLSCVSRMFANCLSLYFRRISFLRTQISEQT